MDNANSFDMNKFTREAQSYMVKQYTAVEQGKEAMEQRVIEKAEKAVNQNSFLSLTLTEKLEELGVGGRVAQQIGDTAINLFKDALITPVTDYLEKYENIFDQEAYNAEFQSYAKQTWFSAQALKEEAASKTAGTRFVFDM